MTIYIPPERHQAKQRQIIHECFNGKRERECDECQAHHTEESGLCCFGDPDEHDSEDESCSQCVFLDDCAEATVEFVEMQEQDEIEHQATQQSYTQHYRPSYRTRVPVKKPRIVARPKKKNRLVQIGRTRRPIQTASPAQLTVNEDGSFVEPIFHRFLKESARGGLIGAFRMAAEFLEMHPFP